MTWEYISGFFDADGSITISKDSINQEPHISISFSNNERTILELMKDFILNETTVKGFIVHKKPKNVNHADSYELCYSSTPKALLLSKFIQSNHPKKVARLLLIPQIKELTPRNGKYSQETLLKRRALIQHFLSL